MGVIRLALLAVFFALPASADNLWDSCDDLLTRPTGAEDSDAATTLSPSKRSRCYRFTALAEDSSHLTATDVKFRFCFLPDTLTTGGTARVQLDVAAVGAPGGATDANIFVPVVDADLTGVGGSSSAQNVCSEVQGPGTYRVNVTAAPGGSEVPVVRADVVEILER